MIFALAKNHDLIVTEWQNKNRVLQTFDQFQSRIYLSMNKLYDAKSYLDNALKVNSSSYKAWSILAQIQQQMKQYEKASNSYLTSLELQRDQPIEPFSSVPRWLP